MSLNEKIESIIYKAWLKVEKHYYVSVEGDVFSEWSKKSDLELELENYFGLDWDNYIEIHEIKVTHERIK